MSPPLVWKKIPSIPEAARSRGKEVATQASVSSESGGWSQRVIYSLWGGERAGDPEKGAGQGDLGHVEDEGWWESTGAAGQAEGKVGGAHGSGGWQRGTGGSRGAACWSVHPTSPITGPWEG